MIEDKEADKVTKDIAEEMFSDWINNLEEKEQPTSCSINNPDCENCGS